MNITITIPLSMRPVATRDTAWHVESPGTTTAPDDAEIVLAHRGQEGRVRLRAIGSRLMSAWAYPISEEAYQRHLAEIARLRLQKAASHEAWARYVTAAIEDRDAQFAEEQEMAGAEEWRVRTQKNLAITTAALRDLGVDVNTLLNAKTRTT